MARTILVAVKDLLFGSKIQEAGKRTGTALQWSPRFDRLRDVAETKAPDVIIADLGEPGMLDELAAVREKRPGTRILGFAGHVQEDLMAQAQQLGVTEVFSKGQFNTQLDRILARERGEG